MLPIPGNTKFPGRDLSRAIPTRDYVPNHRCFSGNARPSHELADNLGGGIVVVTTDETRSSTSLRSHRAGLLKQEEDLGIHSAIERIEIWNSP